ncbi:response regulator [Steroidobacter agaridevorans]|uniref:Response regulator n=1 Tax=Steroidobacter agaridevorans TaxID=2695856 RepID=A0A829YKF6_9GAMM|nr:response regulator [Steroidobacter agaridevorans]GFE83795.1 response regulator [Steroidobacter agaridevorans]
MNRDKLREILYVDDEPDIREIVQMALGLVPTLSVNTADSGMRALQSMRASKPDLVLLDVMMPNMDGPTTLQQMRSQPELQAIPVIFMTAKAMPQEVARFRALGAAAVIAKPFDPMLLAEHVLSIWETL